MTVRSAAPDNKPAVVHKRRLDTGGQTRERDRRIARKQTYALFDEAPRELFLASDSIAITWREHHPT